MERFPSKKSDSDDISSKLNQLFRSTMIMRTELRKLRKEIESLKSGNDSDDVSDCSDSDDDSDDDSDSEPKLFLNRQKKDEVHPKVSNINLNFN